MTFDQQIGRLVSGYGRPINDEMEFEYSQALGDVPIEVLALAITRAIRHRKFLPTVAELVEEVETVLNEQRIAARNAAPFAGCDQCGGTGWREEVAWYRTPVSLNGQLLAQQKTTRYARCECWKEWLRSTD